MWNCRKIKLYFYCFKFRFYYFACFESSTRFYSSSRIRLLGLEVQPQNNDHFFGFSFSFIRTLQNILILLDDGLRSFIWWARLQLFCKSRSPSTWQGCCPATARRNRPRSWDRPTTSPKLSSSGSTARRQYRFRNPQRKPEKNDFQIIIQS